MELWLYWLVGLSISTVAGAELVRRYRNNYGYPMLVSIYVAFILVSNIMASRLAVYDILGISVITAGATLMFPFVAQVADMINEVYGRRATYAAILMTLVTNVIASFMIYHVASEPPALEAMGAGEVYEDAWRFFMLQAPRIVAASYAAFWIANTLDAKVFADLKKFFYARYREAYRDLRTITAFVLARSVVSDVVNMVVDSLVFFPLAFAFVLPLEALPQITMGGAYVKLFVILITQPFLIGYRLLIRDVERTID